ncbi:sigma-70 family RNA polymerase sigma factor [Thauera linaloolentis]|uniref:ECF subfamily RNA polymerase sigma factor n=1 Tax=Thauera linaloolentis (strain DSM 12138 / JCM 21573 / CCUG 41526 / CIP 105981 / IAM 15112 / NBRC 102519 / 47Lol) TaxID=1123367 RepID=N6Z7T9_THAL4|nr:sigma-70 family RNA polymerase sigma factor [Thauera linaloolentis]ENO90662.1 ECF subfamily RNA polymerase sigma factor [Thauera linaloolentis 47Lol = DSM 12138]MCM8565570.1 sigma-70 family RNA polymerase sigma factor [Thauera linaloolentis]
MAKPPAATYFALEALYLQHEPWLRARLRRRLSNAADAEDLAADTFMQIMHRHDLHTLREPRAFLTTVAKRLLFQLWQRRDLEQTYLDHLARQPETEAPSPEELLMALQSLHGIAQALDGLSENARRAFLYSQIDGLGYAEIAQRLGVSTASVRHYMAQGFRQCALMLASQATPGQAPPGPPRPGRPRKTAADAP